MQHAKKWFHTVIRMQSLKKHSKDMSEETVEWMEEIHGPLFHFPWWNPHTEVMERRESPVRLSIVSAQLLPEDPVTSWGG